MKIKHIRFILLLMILGNLHYTTGGNFAHSQEQLQPWGVITRLGWSPSGNQIVFESLDNPNKPDVSGLWVVDVDGDNPTKLTEDHENAAFPKWSPDGNWIAFWLNYEDVAIISMDSGLEITNLTSDLNRVDPFFEWSPDSQSIIATSYTTNNDSSLLPALWSLTIHKLEANLLVEEKSAVFEYTPNWTSDGQQIVFTYTPEVDALSEIISIDVNDLTQSTLISGKYIYAVLSPDNHSIVALSYTNCEQGLDVILIDLESLQVTNLSNNECSAIGWPVEWSPDSRCIAYQSHFDTFTVLNLLNLDAQAVEGDDPVWSPNGKQIGYTLNKDGESNIWLLNVDDFTSSMLFID